MSEATTVLLLGATGRTGRRVLDHLVRRGVRVRAIVRAIDRVPTDLRDRPGVELVEADLLALDDAALQRHVAGVDVVISCLGHVMSLRGVFGAPRDLVTRAVSRAVAAVRATQRERPVRLVLMSSVSVNQPGRRDARRGGLERAIVALLRVVLPPANDNQAAADHLVAHVAPDDPAVEWVVVRPDSLIDGHEGPYDVHPALVDSLFAPGRTTMGNIGAFMADLAVDDDTWARWRGRMPVIVDTPSAAA